MICPNCGATNSDSDKFCRKCGYPLAVEEPPEMQVPASAKSPKLLFPTVAVVLVGIIVLAFLQSRAATSDGVSSSTASSYEQGQLEPTESSAKADESDTKPARTEDSKEISNESEAIDAVSEEANSIPEMFPLKWGGTYVGRTTRNESGLIDRNVDMTFTRVDSDGTIEGTCMVGRGQQDQASGRYYLAGHIDWATGYISLEGTGWQDKGTLESWGGFRGTMDSQGKTIDGEWYDPTGTASGSSPWHMHAVD